jgi:phage terminase large subunit
MALENKYLEELIGPELLSIPPKLQEVLLRFNDYKIFVIEGGRGSAKTHTIGRLLMYIAQERVVRVFCGREIQSTIEESVYTLFMDLINKYNLAYRPTKAQIRHLQSGSTFRFKGFREQGNINIKGIEGADIVWVDEAQSVQQTTLDYLLPTLRKETPVKFIFTMNRLFRDDAVMELTKRPDCLHIHIDYFENPHCPVTLLDEAELCRINSPRDYNHIWLGQPASSGDLQLFDFDKLYASNKNQPYGELYHKQRVMGIDWAAQGNDSCVATILDRKSSIHFELNEQIKWDDPNTTTSTGKIIGLIAEWKPDVIIIDIGGGGYNVYCDLVAAKISNLYAFDGGSKKGIGPRAINLRAEGYWNLKDWFEQEFLCIGERFRETLKQGEKLRFVPRSDGLRQAEPKKDYKQREGFSPDELDSLMMTVFGCRYLGKNTASQSSNGMVQRRSGSNRKR